MDRTEGFTRLDDELALPGGHPLAPRDAWSCDICHGIFYPSGDIPAECPYCTEDDAA